MARGRCSIESSISKSDCKRPSQEDDVEDKSRILEEFVPKTHPKDHRVEDILDFKFAR